MDETNTINLEHPDVAFHETKVMAIDGMTCDRCVQKIEKALRDKKGIVNFRIDKEDKIVTVTFDSREIKFPDIHDILLKHGYRATSKVEEE